MVENNLLRIGQEAIFNATKYANAKRITVEVKFGAKEFQLVVRDDGCGFDAAHPPTVADSFGLTAMRERAGELKGKLQVNSNRQRGTEVIFTMPLSPE